MSLWSPRTDGLSDLEVRDILRDITSWVRLDEEGEVTPVKIGRDWGVGTGDFFVIDGSGDGDVLADWEPEDVICSGEGETVAGGSCQ